jgi:hypothetical protein
MERTSPEEARNGKEGGEFGGGDAFETFGNVIGNGEGGAIELILKAS